MGKDTESRARRCGGFTLLETVMALTIASIALLFFTGFLVPQLKLYYRFGRTSEAKQVCGRIYREIEEQLRYGYDFAVDPEDPATLYYPCAGDGAVRGRVPERRRGRWAAAI